MQLYVKLSEIPEKCFQDVRYMNAADDVALLEDIRINGLQNPLTFIAGQETLKLQDGARRLRALKILNYEFAPVNVIIPSRLV